MGYDWKMGIIPEQDCMFANGSVELSGNTREQMRFCLQCAFIALFRKSVFSCPHLSSRQIISEFI